MTEQQISEIADQVAAELVEMLVPMIENLKAETLAKIEAVREVAHAETVGLRADLVRALDEIAELRSARAARRVA